MGNIKEINDYGVFGLCHCKGFYLIMNIEHSSIRIIEVNSEQ